MSQSIENHQSLGASLVGGGSSSALVIRSVQSWISHGRLRLGDIVPSERELATACGVSRGTARAALDALEKEGVILKAGNRRRVASSPHDEYNVMDDTIGVLTLNPEQILMPQDSEGWERFVEVGAAEAIGKAGMHVLGVYSERITNEALGRLLRQPPAGLIAGGHVQESAEGLRIITQLAQAGVKIVVYGDGPKQAPYDRVCSDHELGTYELTRWLLRERGRRRILRFWGKNDPLYPYWLANRDRGYERAMAEAGIEMVPALQIGGFEFPGDRVSAELETRLVAGYLLEHVRGTRRIDAIMAITDGAVQAIAAACRLHGLEPNGDIDIVGYDNYWRQASSSQRDAFSPAATVEKHNRKMGHEMVALLRRRLAGELPPSPQRIVVPPELVIVGNAAG